MKKIFWITLLIFCFFPFVSQAAQIKTVKIIKPIKILIVPGHDNEVWGAQYKNLKEADMNLVLATQIYNLLKKDKRYKVYITRNSQGYVKEFADYFMTEKDNIITFKTKAKEATQNKIDTGSLISKINVPHNAVSADTSIKLYGINKWANENKIDLVLSVHFDDTNRSTLSEIGPYKGFTVYYPDSQMANAKESVSVAKSIFNKLHKKFTTSTYPEENNGFVSDQKLIALGASGTLNSTVRAVLIEYGYIYRFGNSAMRHKFYTNAASLTAQGITNYFFPAKK